MSEQHTPDAAEPTDDEGTFWVGDVEFSTPPPPCRGWPDNTQDRAVAAACRERPGKNAKLVVVNSEREAERHQRRVLRGARAWTGGGFSTSKRKTREVVFDGAAKVAPAEWTVWVQWNPPRSECPQGDGETE